MGFSIFYLAVKGKSSDAVRHELNLQATGTRESFPDSPITAAHLPDGWFLIVWNHTDIPNAVVAGSRGCILDRLSSGCELITCFAEEHAMYSEATAWNDGRKIWTVIHDAQQGIMHLAAKGDLPPDFASIRDEQISRQRAEEEACDHVFDIPVATVQKLTGFRYDNIVEVEQEEAFEVLAESAPASRPLLKRLFGA